MERVDNSLIRKLWSRATSAILHAIVDRVVDDKKFPRCQVEWLADRISPDVEYRQPQGVYFVPKTGAEGLLAAPGGDRSTAVLICAQAREDSPGSGGIAEGEGGLYYAGEFKIFLDASGNVHLGEKSGAEFVALADKVKSELDGIKSDLDLIKNHTHTVPITGPAGTTPTTPPVALVLTYSPTTPAATKVKAT